MADDQDNTQSDQSNAQLLQASPLANPWGMPQQLPQQAPMQQQPLLVRQPLGRQATPDDLMNQTLNYYANPNIPAEQKKAALANTPPGLIAAVKNKLSIVTHQMDAESHATAQAKLDREAHPIGTALSNIFKSGFGSPAVALRQAKMRMLQQGAQDTHEANQIEQVTQLSQILKQMDSQYVNNEMDFADRRSKVAESIKKTNSDAAKATAEAAWQNAQATAEPKKVEETARHDKAAEGIDADKNQNDLLRAHIDANKAVLEAKTKLSKLMTTRQKMAADNLKAQRDLNAQMVHDYNDNIFKAQEQMVSGKKTVPKYPGMAGNVVPVKQIPIGQDTTPAIELEPEALRNLQALAQGQGPPGIQAPGPQGMPAQVPPAPQGQPMPSGGTRQPPPGIPAYPSTAQSTPGGGGQPGALVGPPPSGVSPPGKYSPMVPPPPPGAGPPTAAGLVPVTRQIAQTALAQYAARVGHLKSPSARALERAKFMAYFEKHGYQPIDPGP